MKNLSLNTIASTLLMLSGALHIIAFALGGFSYGLFGFAPFGLFCVALGYALHLSASRLLSYIGFFATGIGASFLLREGFVTLAIPSWWIALMIIASFAATATLFVLLWRAPRPVDL